MKRLFFVIIIVTAVSASFVGCAKTRSRSLPTRESVEAVMTTFVQLDHAFGLCIIAGAPARVPTNPMSLEAAEKDLALAKKELAFLEGIKSTKPSTDVRVKAKAYLQAPSQKTAREFRASLDLFIRQFRNDTQAPLWQELVPNSLTTKALDEVQQLEQQAGQM